MLGELNRRTLVERWYDMIQRFDLSLVPLLWPAGADIRAELGAINRRRNIYIHQGRIDDYVPYVRDLWRIQRFAELCILKLLDCPAEAINTKILTEISTVPIRHGGSE